ncbi:cyclic nucleotide-binding domain-containing protein [Luedemannella helvata]|uniref:Cyclic nucleotide-binding domain-containing protein n=1 Tax=Luedemannella helvata TaxID=349315 RepID=A0ABP4WXD1_9ACTN
MTIGVGARVARHPFLAGLAPAHRAELAEYAAPAHFAAHERIFTEGGSADRFWLIEKGVVALDMREPGRTPLVVETLPAGTVLGWSWLVAPYRWAFGARAWEPVEALAFDAAAVRVRCDADPGFGYAVLRCFVPVILERMQTTRLRLLDLYALPGPAAGAWP